jgi:hypothetical protein
MAKPPGFKIFVAVHEPGPFDPEGAVNRVPNPADSDETEMRLVRPYQNHGPKPVNSDKIAVVLRSL